MNRGSLLRRLYRFTWRYKMTPPGKLLTAIIGIASIGTVTIEVPIYFVCCGFLGLVFAAELAGSLMRPRLTVESRWPATMTAGEVATIPVRITNRTWRPALDVMLTLLDRPWRLKHVNGDVVLPRLDRHGSFEIPLQVRARGRGRLRAPSIDAHSTFPFNLVRIPGGRSTESTLLVRPAFAPLRGIRLPSDLAADVGEYAPSGETGESIEYLGNREYTPGEPIRRLDFRAWARVGRPVVREYQNEQASRIGILVDTLQGNRRGRAWRARMEGAIATAAAITDGTLRSGYDVGLLATGTDLYLFDEAGSQRLDSVLDLLAEVRRTDASSYHRMVDDLIDETQPLAGLMVLLTDWDEPRRALLDKLREEGPLMRVFLLDDDQTRRQIADDDLASEVERIDLTALTAGEIAEL